MLVIKQNIFKIRHIDNDEPNQTKNICKIWQNDNDEPNQTKTIFKLWHNDNDEPNPWKAQLYEHFGPSQQRPWKDFLENNLIVTMLPPDESWVQCLPLYPEEKKGQNM